jgi:WAS/WASL-interacting protein
VGKSVSSGSSASGSDRGHSRSHSRSRSDSTEGRGGARKPRNLSVLTDLAAAASNDDAAGGARDNDDDGDDPVAYELEGACAAVAARRHLVWDGHLSMVARNCVRGVRSSQHNAASPSLYSTASSTHWFVAVVGPVFSGKSTLLSICHEASDRHHPAAAAAAACVGAEPLPQPYSSLPCRGQPSHHMQTPRPLNATTAGSDSDAAVAAAVDRDDRDERSSPVAPLPLLVSSRPSSRINTARREDNNAARGGSGGGGSGSSGGGGGVPVPTHRDPKRSIVRIHFDAVPLTAVFELSLVAVTTTPYTPQLLQRMHVAGGARATPKVVQAHNAASGISASADATKKATPQPQPEPAPAGGVAASTPAASANSPSTSSLPSSSSSYVASSSSSLPPPLPPPPLSARFQPSFLSTVLHDHNLTQSSRDASLWIVFDGECPHKLESILYHLRTTVPPLPEDAAQQPAFLFEFVDLENVSPAAVAALSICAMPSVTAYSLQHGSKPASSLWSSSSSSPPPPRRRRRRRRRRRHRRRRRRGRRRRRRCGRCRCRRRRRRRRRRSRRRCCCWWLFVCCPAMAGGASVFVTVVART